MQGGAASHKRFFKDLLDKTTALHESIDDIQDPAIELLLKRSCADVARAVYTLRVNGDRIAAEDLKAFDAFQQLSASKTLGGGLPDFAWTQASCSMSNGGLALKSAVHVALPAFIDSRVASKLAAESIFKDLEDAGLFPVSALPR